MTSTHKIANIQKKGKHHVPKSRWWLPFLCGGLYGASWPMFENINTSFLAWFAFCPLFLFLEQNQKHFWKSLAASYLALLTFECLSAGWLFNFPINKLKIAFIFLMEDVWFTMPFLFFYFLHKKIGFDKALWLFPLIWMLWEWTYLHLEFSMGTHLSPYSQSNSLWLIQYIDITGMWGISFWLMLWNVLLYKAYKKAGNSFKNRAFGWQTLRIAVPMLGLPLAYAVFAYSFYRDVQGSKSLQTTLLPTSYSSEYLLDETHQVDIVEQTLHRNDSIAFTAADLSLKNDLYVWPETGIPYDMGEANLSSLLSEAVNDWQSALLAGCKGVIEDNNPQRYVSAVLLSNQSPKPSYHHKTVLTPGQESIPYLETVSALFPVLEKAKYFQKGEKHQPLTLTTQSGEDFKVGVSLCFEQWYPSHWAKMTQNGADCFIHLAGEGWYGNVGFRQFMANVSRMRCIENRKQGARCANIGLSVFIDQMGNYKKASSSASNKEAIRNQLVSNHFQTFYTQYPNLFPLLGIIAFIAMNLIFHFKTQKS